MSLIRTERGKTCRVQACVLAKIYKPTTFSPMVCIAHGTRRSRNARKQKVERQNNWGRSRCSQIMREICHSLARRAGRLCPPRLSSLPHRSRQGPPLMELLQQQASQPFCTVFFSNSIPSQSITDLPRIIPHPPFPPPPYQHHHITTIPLPQAATTIAQGNQGLELSSSVRFFTTPAPCQFHTAAPLCFPFGCLGPPPSQPNITALSLALIRT